MRTFIALAILAVVAVCVNSEGCRRNSDCVNGLTTCAANHALTCHNGGCYCEVTTTSSGSGCSTKDDCPSRTECHSGRGNYHCVDQKCRCFYF